jgi:hypothetical protein
LSSTSTVSEEKSQATMIKPTAITHSGQRAAVGLRKPITAHRTAPAANAATMNVPGWV